MHKGSWCPHDAGHREFRHPPHMQRGSHRILIELDETDGPPRGRISVDESRPQAFQGWIDLTSRLESLRRGSADADARVEGGLDDVGDCVQDHDEERAVHRDRHDRREVQLFEGLGGVLPDAL